MAALLTTLPFTPAGLGVVEVATVSVLKLVDVPVDLAGSVAVLDRLITYWGLIAVGAVDLSFHAQMGLPATGGPGKLLIVWAARSLIDISAAINQGAGIGRYARELTRALIPLLPPDSTRLWYAAESAPVRSSTLVEQSPWSQLAVSRSWLSRRNVDRLLVRAQLPLGVLIGAGHPADSYSPDFTAPPGRRTHVTIHDLAWLHPEAQTPPELANYLAPVVERAVARATTIFTVSSAMRTEILDRHRLPENRVIVAPNAASSQFFASMPLSDADLAALGVHRPFLLSVGTIQPRKNLPVLFEALARLPDDVMLVVVGENGWDAKRQLEPIDRLKLHRRVVRPGYVAEQALASLYASAAAVVYPSWYEGFGLPVIEALAAGVPVVASDIEAVREVGGNEVSLFDPSKPESLASAIERVISGADESESASARRRLQARKFGWEQERPDRGATPAGGFLKRDWPGRSVVSRFSDRARGPHRSGCGLGRPVRRTAKSSRANPRGKALDRPDRCIFHRFHRAHGRNRACGSLHFTQMTTSGRQL